MDKVITKFYKVLQLQDPL